MHVFKVIIIIIIIISREVCLLLFFALSKISLRLARVEFVCILSGFFAFCLENTRFSTASLEVFALSVCRFCTVPYNNFTRIVCATQSSRSPHSISEHTFASQSINSLHTYVCVDRYLFAHRSLKRFFSRLD
jgi:hypothetical protein